MLVPLPYYKSNICYMYYFLTFLEKSILVFKTMLLLNQIGQTKQHCYVINTLRKMFFLVFETTLPST